MAQPNAIRQSTIPGLALGDVSNADTLPSPSAARGEAVDAGGGPPIVLPGAATIDGPAATPSLRTLGAGAQQAMPGNFSPPVDGAAATPSLRTLGAGAQQAMPGNTAIPGASPLAFFGKSIVGTTEGRTNAAYGLLTTPDRVQNVVLPANGLIFALFQATWQESVAGAAKAAIFIGANQLKAAVDGRLVGGTAPDVNVQEAQINSNATSARDTALTSFELGLAGMPDPASAAYPSDVATGQVVGFAAGSTRAGYVIGANSAPAAAFYAGGPCQIFAAAGTYDISVQFKASSGTVTVRNRKLWVWTIG